jgi:hypothetical protein
MRHGLGVPIVSGALVSMMTFAPGLRQQIEPRRETSLKQGAVSREGDLRAGSSRNAQAAFSRAPRSSKPDHGRRHSKEKP